MPVSVPAYGEKSFSISEKVINPRKWSAELSNLYHLVLTLKDPAGNIAMSTGCRIYV